MSAPDYRYWDSSCFLALIKGEPGRVDVCESIVQAAYRGDHVIVTSAITLAEVVRPGRKGPVQMTEGENAKIVGFFRSTFLRFVDFNPTMGQLTRELQWRHGLHVRDAIHAATAISAKVPVLETYDPDFLKLDRSSIPGCPEIRQPMAQIQKTIFEVTESTAPPPAGEAPPKKKG